MDTHDASDKPDLLTRLVALLQSNAVLIIILCILYFLWTRRPKNRGASPNDQGLYENNNTKLTTVHEAMLAQRERLQDGYQQIATDFAAKQNTVEKEIEEKRKENKIKTKSQRNDYNVPDRYYPLTGAGGGSYRPARKGRGGGG
ncbi:hypothetical protein LOD99_15739 [Oopsacas minuta]|uniref:Selenoprotein S n=1 Tax=Oopsacas minuta TaxID=111878 RepID=A0AAV7KD70_9METZ|nr:hypothetical protein LOD99_15739 [Oopsacas minuta]